MEIQTILKSFRAHYPHWKEQLRKRMQLIELNAARDKEVTKRIVERKTTRDRAVARRAQVQARQIEAEIALAAERTEHRKLLKQKAWILMERERQQAESLNHDVTGPEGIDPDIVRDIRWVYDNWKDLFVTTELGARVFDEKVLEQAPSPGAVAMANYALGKPDGFFDRFVIKLLPKDAGAAADDDSGAEDAMAELDPSFDDMKDFWNMEVEPERVTEASVPAEEEIDW